MRLDFILAATTLAILLSRAEGCGSQIVDLDHITDFDPVIGIDLGTTYSCVGVYKDGKVEIVPNELGNRVTPSWVSFADHERLVGEAAKTKAAENTFYDVKRFIGKLHDDPSVNQDKKLYPFEVTNKGNKPVMVAHLGGSKVEMYPEEISAIVLSHLKEIAEAFIGKPVKNAVITVPAYFNDIQRQATKDAGTISGLNVLRVLNEPTAAAVAYGLDEGLPGEKNILVYDLGGGTFDVSLMTIDDGIFEVIATSGDIRLGGEDFDHRIMDHIVKLFKKKHSADFSKDKRAMQRLKREVEKAKRALSSSHQVRIEIDDLYDGIDLSEPLSRAFFEELNLDLFKRTLTPVQTVLDQSGLEKQQIDEIVMVGGSTRIPKVAQLLKNFFNGTQPNESINPDEAVCYGAAVQGSILSGEAREGMILLCGGGGTVLAVGVETFGGFMATLVPRNSMMPTKRSLIFSTSQDNQTSVVVQILTGQRAMAKDNHILGRLELNGIPPSPRGVPQIEVAFEFDSNDNLYVTAEDKNTGNKVEKFTIDQMDLSTEAIARMIDEAEEMAEEDKRVRETVEFIENCSLLPMGSSS